ncbi:MAG TPA: hypothetical protein VF727_12240 [Allosphingosinicella sp.]
MADDVTFHSKRALVEIDLASRAVHPGAARAHLALSNLHLQRLRALASAAAGVSL